MNKPVIRRFSGITFVLGAAIALATAVGQAQGGSQPSAASASSGAAPPRGYLVANYTIHDQQTFQKYMEAAGPLAPKFNGKVIIYDVTSRTMEGKPKSVMAVAEFPTVADAERFYNSPEYSAARQFRIASTDGSAVLAEGLPQAIQAGEPPSRDRSDARRAGPR